MVSLKVINLWGAPGAGKSTTAAGLFNLMKQMGLSVELVTEYAKDLTWEKNASGLCNQLHVLGVQDQRLRRLDGQVEWAITDSPLPLGIAYLTEEYAELGLSELTLRAYERYVNYDFLIRRKKPYVATGRNQTEAEALILDVGIRNIFRVATEWDGQAVDLVNAAFEVDGDEFAPFNIAKNLPLPQHLEKLLAA